VREYVVAADDLEPIRAEGDTAETRVAFDAAQGSRVLEQRVVRFAPGRSLPQPLDGLQGILYVASGAGSLEVDRRSHSLEPETAAYCVGEPFVVDNPGSGELVAVLVTAPVQDGHKADPDRRTVRLADRSALPAGTDREFRYLMHADTGCPDVTQFVGTIPPGRAPMHSHVYDEVVYVLEGTGQLHIAGGSFPLAPGSCLHLPALVEHALENATGAEMRVLGVFHPSGDPASRASEANE
jgi:mannose-6-phosphate isomerase-like protein (cupin superfamily)